MASIYEEGLQLIDEKFGNGKDNITKTAPFMLLHMENQTKCYK